MVAVQNLVQLSKERLTNIKKEIMTTNLNNLDRKVRGLMHLKALVSTNIKCIKIVTYQGELNPNKKRQINNMNFYKLKMLIVE